MLRTLYKRTSVSLFK
jgi:enoyl-CoA hydratase